MTSTSVVVAQDRSERDDRQVAVSMPGVYGSMQSFEDAQRMAGALCASSLVPETYQGNKANCMIALEMAQRTGSSPMAVMQNLHIIHGRPSWSSQFVIAALNSCGRFSPMRYKVEDLGMVDAKIDEWSGPKGNRTKSSRIIKVHNQRCTAWCYDKATNDILEGPPVSIEMAVAEGWYTKDGSKWVTMPDLMLRYRAAKFFGNLYAPDVLMGMHSAEEVEDFSDQPPLRVQAATQTATSTTNKADPLSDLNSFAHTHKPDDAKVEETKTTADSDKGESSSPKADAPEPRQRRPRNTAPKETKPEPEPEPQTADDGEVIEGEFVESGPVTEEEPESKPVNEPKSDAPVKDLF